MDAHEYLECSAGQMGWDEHTMYMMACQFIDEICAEEDFAEFLSAIIEVEQLLGDQP